MTKMLMQWKFGALRPADAAAIDYAGKLKSGQVVTCEIKRVRNVRQLRLWWALMTVIWEHQEACQTKEAVSDKFKVWLGHFDEMQLPDGRMVVNPKSIAFGSLSQDAWEDLFDAAIKLVCSRVIPGTKDEDLRRHLEEMVGAQAAA